VAVNYSDHASQCYLRLPFPDLAEQPWRFGDLFGGVTYDRDGDDLRARGLFLDLQPRQYHVFEMGGRRAIPRAESRQEDPAIGAALHE
jgi:hypothetical protein